MLLSVERPNRGSLCLLMTKGHAAALYGLVQAVLPASVWNMANGSLRVPRNLGESYFCSSTKSRLEIPGYQLQALAAHSSARERKQRVHPRYRQAKETKCGGMAAGRHSVLIVPMKLANSTRLEPAEESETPIHGTVFEKHDECLEIRQSCPRNRNG